MFKQLPVLVVYLAGIHNKWPSNGPLRFAYPDMYRINLTHKDKMNSLQGKMWWWWWCLWIHIFLPYFSSALIWKTLTKQSFGIGSSMWSLPLETTITSPLREGDLVTPQWLRAQIQILCLLLSILLGFRFLHWQNGDNNHILLIGLLQSIIFIVS